MPVEIRQLIIKATVTNGKGGEGGGGKSSKKDQASIVNECVEQVMEILRDKKER